MNFLKRVFSSGSPLPPPEPQPVSQPSNAGRLGKPAAPGAGEGGECTHNWAGCRCLTCGKRAWRGHTHVWSGNACSACYAPRPPCAVWRRPGDFKKVHLSTMNALFLRERRYPVLFNTVRRTVGTIRIIDMLFENGMEFRNVDIDAENEMVYVPASYVEEPVKTISIPTADRQQANPPFSAQAADMSLRVYQPNDPEEFESEYGIRV